jgi:predicted nucleic acid-binding protein
MADTAVVDTSPIITLTRAGWIDLLRAGVERVVIPAAVAAEIRRRGPEDPAVAALSESAWLEVVDSVPIDDRIADCNLDPGESAVLTWTLAHPNREAILDDQAARRCAEMLAIPYRGTLGVVAEAKLAGIIPSARLVIAGLRRAGLFVSDQLVARVLATVGE